MSERKIGVQEEKKTYPEYVCRQIMTAEIFGINNWKLFADRKPIVLMTSDPICVASERWWSVHNRGWPDGIGLLVIWNGLLGYIEIYSLFTLWKSPSPLKINGNRTWLRVSRLYFCLVDDTAMLQCISDKIAMMLHCYYDYNVESQVVDSTMNSSILSQTVCAWVLWHVGLCLVSQTALKSQSASYVLWWSYKCL